MPNMQTPQTYTETLVAKDGTRFVLTANKFEPTYAYRLLAKIGRVLVPAVMAAKSVNAQSAALDLMPAVNAMFDQLTPDLADSARDDLLLAMSVARDDEQGKPERIDLVSPKNINRAFRGGYLRELLLAMKFSLGVNFGDFFGVSATSAVAETPTP